MMRRVTLAVLALLLAQPALAKDDLVIGVSQFPSSLHPNIDPEVIKTYVLDFAIRPTSAFDKAWNNVCILCTDLPTLQNGLVRIEDRAGGGKGMAVTVKLRPGIVWGDGVKVTANDLAFTAKVGRDPTSGFANTRVWGRVTSVEVLDDLTAVLHLDEVSTLYDRLPGVLPEHIEGPVYARVAGSGDYG
ncbi:MAG: ABC transporter substrate-binding protein, partial [Nevskiales bacterium]